MSKTIRYAREVYRAPKLKGVIREASRAKQELRLNGYKPSNRIKARSNLSYPNQGRISSGFKEQYEVVTPFITK